MLKKPKTERSEINDDNELRYFSLFLAFGECDVVW